ncbi:hypothetical protein AB0J80_23955 [Actinoplanes sp. NPDC049548]|uniref:hypothetical protein n=1 Tax=Actinoplanes sp. NPDC049548 TaxID=3155152 RepID=UPI0034178416
MRTDAGSSGLKVFAVPVVAVTAGLMTASCTDDQPVAKSTPPASSSSAAGPSMTFDEAYRRVPMNGTKDLRITWDLSGAPDTDEVLAARRSLAFMYWEGQATDWTPIIPVGRFVFTEGYYEKFLAPFANSSAVEDPLAGPIWVKFMGVEENGADQSTVTFCTDIGYWLRAKDNTQVRKNRANLESYVVKSVESGEGERRWRGDRWINNDGSRKAKYGARCTQWAQHKR